jgi:hypothetical protein
MMLGNRSRIERWAGGIRLIRENRPMRACLAAIAVLALAGCGSSTGAGASTQGTGSSGSSSATGTGTTSSQTTSTTTTTTAATTSAGHAPCTASGLALTFLGQQGATGHGELGLVLRNTGSSPCQTIGYPGILFLDKDGAPLPTDSTRTTHDFFGRTHVASLVILPGASASFRVGVTHGASSTKGCTTAAGLQVIPPNDTATMHASIPDGAFECGTATVSPLEAGNAAYP